MSKYDQGVALEQRTPTDIVRERGKLDTGDGFATDQIGWLVPAVPSEEGDTFWGYMSVPQAGCDWWDRLPTRWEKTG